MAAEPPEEEIENFISFTSSSREQAIHFLNANSLDSNKAINAYFENPNSFQSKNENDWSTYYTPGHNYSSQNIPSFNIEHSDSVLKPSYSAPPSRPPSRMNSNNASNTPKPDNMDISGADTSGAPTQNMTAAQREAHDLQQAVAMSLNHGYEVQETGVTSASNPNFSRATRDHYDEGTWAMTLFNSSNREIIISPDPEDRRRFDDEPAFLRPSQESQYLAGFFTILHSIPIAREALLLRNKILPGYGHDPQWWNGQSINVPKIVSLEDAREDEDNWDDVLFESQRLISFLDATERAFGSADALANLTSVTGYDSDGGIQRFLEAWQDAAVRATPDNQLSMIFASHALKRPLSELDTPIEKDFLILEPSVEIEHGQTLYDVLDRAVWADRPGEELDDVWLEHVAEVLIIRLEASDATAKSIDVKIPAVFYPDRYLQACRAISREFRMRKLDVYTEIFRLDDLMNRYAVSPTASRTGMTTKQMLEKAAAAASIVIPRSLVDGYDEAGTELEYTQQAALQLASELRDLSAKVDAKLKDLEVRRQTAIETLRNYSKALTERSSNPLEPPHVKYTLRGVCTTPDVTYILRRQPPNEMESNEVPSSGAHEQWQWWRISFSVDDGKDPERSNRVGKKHKKPRNTDIAGYTARKVREIEVIRAARDESNNVLLVYANENAVDFPQGTLPPQLQEFISHDNQAFQSELAEAEQELQAEGTASCDSTQPLDGSVQSRESYHDAQPPQKGSYDENTDKVNVFDYQVGSFDGDSSHGQEMQEMQERSGGISLNRQSNP